MHQKSRLRENDREGGKSLVILMMMSKIICK